MQAKKSSKSLLVQISDAWEHRTSKITLPGLEGLTLHDLWVIYSGGIMKGTFST
jgi:membrane protein